MINSPRSASAHGPGEYGRLLAVGLYQGRVLVLGDELPLPAQHPEEPFPLQAELSIQFGKGKHCLGAWAILILQTAHPGIENAEAIWLQAYPRVLTTPVHLPAPLGPEHDGGGELPAGQRLQQLLHRYLEHAHARGVRVVIEHQSREHQHSVVQQGSARVEGGQGPAGVVGDLELVGSDVAYSTEQLFDPIFPDSLATSQGAFGS